MTTQATVTGLYALLTSDQSSGSFYDDLGGRIHEGVAPEEETLPLWRLLGVEPERAAGGLTRLSVRGIRSSQRLHVYLRADRSAPGVAHLNDGGVVCLSFFCRDADRLRDALASAGYDAGECFDIQPFEAPLRIFFMRNASGEIYEFLSVSARGPARGA